MKKTILTVFLMMSIVSTSHAISNVALGSNVTLNGTFYTGGWSTVGGADASTIVDGVFLNRGHQWDQGTVWWDANIFPNNFITIGLGGEYPISSLIVQADDNDAYILSYWNGATWSMIEAWDVPNYDAYGWGMQTRPNPANDSEQYYLTSGITTSWLRFEGNNNDGDMLFSVSEIQAYGSVPEPSTLLLLGSGLVGLGLFGRKRKI